MSSKVYDYAIIGAGAAGLNLALALKNDDFFKTREILILDKEEKSINDRTWCFWEAGDGQWDDIIHHRWTKGVFYSGKEQKKLNMGDYQYKMLRSIDFYRYCREQLEEHPGITWVQDDVDTLSGEDPTFINGSRDSYSARHVFDSRVDQGYFEAHDKYTRLLQHFKGWFIETDKEVFDPRSFTMMDFRVKWQGQASFTYVLPTSPTTALVEFTLFTSQLIPDSGYDEMLTTYMKKYIKSDYNITEIEKGVIPMTDYPFHAATTRQVTKIGTAGSWVKPSSGYSFKNAEKFARCITHNLKTGLDVTQGIADKRHRLYDSIFLDVLHHHNKLGEKIFTTMYQKNPAHLIFRFLDEETDLKEDLRIINKFQYNRFLQALFRQLKRLF